MSRFQPAYHLSFHNYNRHHEDNSSKFHSHKSLILENELEDGGLMYVEFFSIAADDESEDGSFINMSLRSKRRRALKEA